MPAETLNWEENSMLFINKNNIYILIPWKLINNIYLIIMCDLLFIMNS